MLILIFYFIFLFAFGFPRTDLGCYQGDCLTNSILITCFCVSLCCEGPREPRHEVLHGIVLQQVFQKTMMLKMQNLFQLFVYLYNVVATFIHNFCCKFYSTVKMLLLKTFHSSVILKLIFLLFLFLQKKLYLLRLPM